MSSMRNAAPRRPHKERSQPQARFKWGLLEKHKDYSLRAQDYNLKKKKLTQLSRKAEEKNPDEFAFGMLSAGTAAQGKHGARTEESRLSHDAVRLLKTQDAGYLKNVVSRGRKEMKKLEETSVVDRILREGGKMAVIASGRKIIFDEDGLNLTKGKKRDSNGIVKAVTDHGADIGVDAEMSEDTNEPDMAGHTLFGSNQPDTSDLFELTDNAELSTGAQPKTKKALIQERKTMVDLRAVRKKRKKLQEVREAKLAALRRRQKEIMAAADLLELQRAKMAKTIGGVNKDGVKFKIRERKR